MIGAATRRSWWVGLATAVVGVWGVALVVSVVSPVLVTGTDPTELPVWALAAPVGAALVTRPRGL